jgi:hypothetical protein
MPSWEEAHAAAISAFSSVVNDVGNTYQQVLFSGAGVYQSQDTSREISGRVVNPEYGRAEQAYIAQEREREYWEGITVDDYQPTDIDWREYGQYIDEMRATRRELYDRQPEPQDLEPDR